MHEALAAVEEFVAAFNALDIARLSACFSEQASLYPPADTPSELIEGKAAVLEHFGRVFRLESPQGPGIRPQQITLHPLGTEAALVTFGFRRAGGSVGKRSIVLAKETQDWRIVHIHASNTTPHEASA
jgi:ketosteroid isomerase-like protein